MFGRYHTPHKIYGAASTPYCYVPVPPSQHRGLTIGEGFSAIPSLFT